MSELYGSRGADNGSGAGDHGGRVGSDRSADNDSWENYDPEAELERQGITRSGEYERSAAAWDRLQDGNGDDQADGGWAEGPEAENCADINAPVAEGKAGKRPHGTDEDDAAIAEPGEQAEQGLAAQEDGLPSPKESRAATWGGNPEYYDEVDLAEGFDPDDPGRVTRRNEREQALTGDRAPGGDLPADDTSDPDAGLVQDAKLPESRTRQEVSAEMWDARGYADTMRPGRTPEPGQKDEDRLRERAFDDQGLQQRLADLESANTRLESANAELQSENAQLGKNVAEVGSENTELRRGMSALDARLERLEQKADDPTLVAMRGSEQDAQTVAEETKQHQPERPEWRSNEAIGLAAAVGGGVITTIADYWNALPATYAGIAAGALGISAATVGWYRKHREMNDAHRPEH